MKKPTQILSTLFPQTAPNANAEEEAAREKKKKEEEDEKKEHANAWKRMKLGLVYYIRQSVYFIIS